MAEHADDHGGKKEQYFFFVGSEKYESDLPELTGAQIKAKIPNWNPADSLTLEGRGKEPDKLISDTDVVSLKKEHGPLHFIIVPSANFGRKCDLTGLFWTKRFERNCLGKELRNAEEEV